MSEFDRPRNRTKADVRRERRAGRAVVVKDYSPRGWFVRRFYGRPTLRREAAVYQRLAGLNGIPACYGFLGSETLILEEAPGRSLAVLAPGEVTPAVFDALDSILAQIHERGVAIGDLHRSNVLVATDGAVHLIDFAIARIAPDPAHPGWLIRQFQQLDRHAAARLRARYLGLPEPVPTGFFGFFYRFGRRVKRLISRV